MISATAPTLSLWQDRSPERNETALTENLTTEVCIIGAGIAGLTTAYLLAQEGRRVVVIDQATPGGGETGRTTAHLASAIDDHFYEVARRRGKTAARLAGESHRAAIDLIERIVRDERIDCGFKRVPGYLFAGEGGSRRSLEREHDAAREAGQPVEWADSPGGLAFLGRCLRFPNQARFSPLDYLAGLRAALERLGVTVVSRTHALELVEGPNAVVKTDRDLTVSGHYAVLACNTPFNDRVAMHTKLYAYQTYAIAATVHAGDVPDALFWDDLDPYHYVRLADATPGFATLIVGGEDHKTGQQPHPNLAFENLERWARERFPSFGTVTHQWSGEVMETLDGLGYYGRNPGSGENIFVMTGDSGMGMTHGTLGARLVSDLIQQRANPWTEIYDPARKPPASLGEFAKENFNVARQYLDWAKREPSADKDEIALKPGQGRVFQRGTQKIAAHCDENGTIHECSAVCPHLGCIVDWNETEHTWDCPCHGSRFNPRGEVLHGPSPANLAPVPPA